MNLGQRTSLTDRGRGRNRGRGKGGGSKLNTVRIENDQIINNELGKEESNNKNNEETINSKKEDQTKIRKNSEFNSIDKIEEDIEIKVINEVVTTSDMDLSDNLTNNKKRSRDDFEKEKSLNLDSEIMRIMGFDDFQSTKYKHVKGTDCYGINFKQKTEYRQYMNREGGFNRALSPTRGDRKRIKLSLKK